MNDTQQECPAKYDLDLICVKGWLHRVVDDGLERWKECPVCIKVTKFNREKA